MCREKWNQIHWHCKFGLHSSKYSGFRSTFVSGEINRKLVFEFHWTSVCTKLQLNVRVDCDCVCVCVYGHSYVHFRVLVNAHVFEWLAIVYTIIITVLSLPMQWSLQRLRFESTECWDFYLFSQKKAARNLIRIKLYLTIFKYSNHSHFQAIVSFCVWAELEKSIQQMSIE